MPGPVVEPLQETARRLGVHVVVGTYERGAERGVVHNASVLLGRDGAVAGVYRKTHPFCTEMRSRGGWVTPGDEVSVVETDLGRIGQIICFDGDYPELSRITAVRGAEVIVRPSALLRSADIWELTNRARAYDNHVYLVGANATGVDPGGRPLLRQLDGRDARSPRWSRGPPATSAGSAPGSTRPPRCPR